MSEAIARIADTDAFLGVEHSLLGRRWRARLDAAGEAQALALQQAYGFDDVLARVLAGRNVAVANAEAYLNPTIRTLMPDPSTLQDMNAAVERLAHAIETDEKVAIFGDYDVDGACSAALLVDYWRAATAPEPLLHIPDRITEGYGPNIDAIQSLAARGAKLLITVDCGATSHEAFAAARQLGMDVVVLDHHQAPEEIPPAIVVNPNRQDDLSGQGALCAAGVVFIALVGLNRELRRRNWWSEGRPAPDLLASLDLVALATVADVAPLTGLNRAFVQKGLGVMRQRSRPGLAALMDAARMDGPPRAYHLGFVLGPRINAGGRIGDAALGARLLTMPDAVECRRMAEQLESLNSDRRALEAATLTLAIDAAERQLASTNNATCLCVGGEDWHPGIVGLIASRLKERFKLPSFAFAFNEETATGSGRSLSGVDLGRAVRRAVDLGLAVKGGGHAMAAGVTVRRDELDAFSAFMSERLSGPVDAARARDGLVIDAALSIRGATIELAQRVGHAGPFGQENPEPIFVLPDQAISHAALVGEDHVRVRLRAGDGAGLDAIAFRAATTPLGRALLRAEGRHHLAVRIGANFFRGVERVETLIVDAAPAM